MEFFSSFSGQYILYILGFMIVMYAQNKVQRTYHHYKTITNSKGLSGYEIARYILEHNNLSNIKVEVSKGGTLSDHYDPVHKIVYLSSDIYYQSSIASTSVAAHEVGHVLQHKHHYSFIGIRNRLLPGVSIASRLGWIVLVIGLFMFVSTPIIIYIGIAMLLLVLLFQLITLPIEINASTRAMKQLTSLSLINETEVRSVKSMLTSAAFTYIADVLATCIQILKILLVILSFNRKNNE